MSTSGTPALLTVTGPDRPGVTARVMSVLAAHDADLVDVEQVVVNGHLSLGLMVRVDRDADVVAFVRAIETAVIEAVGYWPVFAGAAVVAAVAIPLVPRADVVRV